MDLESADVIRALLHVARKSGALASDDPTVTGRAIVAACNEWEGAERRLVIGELKGAPPWPAYELKILQLGRALDLVQRKLHVWRGRGPLLDAVVSIVSDARFGRGRQSFIAALGEHGAGAYGAELAALLTEPGLAGYVIKALQRSGNGEYLGAVLAAASADGERPWVRSAARMYAAALGQAPPSARFDGDRGPPSEAAPPSSVGPPPSSLFGPGLTFGGEPPSTRREGAGPRGARTRARAG
jgi:hypothetical protein